MPLSTLSFSNIPRLLKPIGKQTGLATPLKKLGHDIEYADIMDRAVEALNTKGTTPVTPSLGASLYDV